MINDQYLSYVGRNNQHIKTKDVSTIYNFIYLYFDINIFFHDFLIIQFYF